MYVSLRGRDERVYKLIFWAKQLLVSSYKGCRVSFLVSCQVQSSPLIRTSMLQLMRACEFFVAAQDISLCTVVLRRPLCKVWSGL